MMRRRLTMGWRLSIIVCATVAFLAGVVQWRSGHTAMEATVAPLILFTFCVAIANRRWVAAQVVPPVLGAGAVFVFEGLGAVSRHVLVAWLAAMFGWVVASSCLVNAHYLFVRRRQERSDREA